LRNCDDGRSMTDIDTMSMSKRAAVWPYWKLRITSHSDCADAAGAHHAHPRGRAHGDRHNPTRVARACQPAGHHARPISL